MLTGLKPTHLTQSIFLIFLPNPSFLTQFLPPHNLPLPVPIIREPVPILRDLALPPSKFTNPPAGGKNKRGIFSLLIGATIKDRM